MLALDEGAEVDIQRLACVGMSRARAILHVIGSQRVLEILKWPV
jgi:hypothetical protein